MSTLPPRKKPHSNTLDHACIKWTEDGQPASSDFDDFYFSTTHGIEETHHVFIEANQLTERFQSLSPSENFTIAETGFGTGLNFLCTWQHFHKHADKHTRLHFISTEKHPLNKKDRMRSLSIWPELNQYIQALSKYHISPVTGQQHFIFDEGRVRLTLLHGDVLNTLPLLEGKVDAWFLDGFSPAKNPDMWQPELYRTMANKSHSQTTYSTFTSARIVRDGLSNAGFIVNKLSGYGLKREMIHGNYSGEIKSSVARALWFEHKGIEHKKLENNQRVSDGDKEVIVVGGGLSGTSTARSLAERGWQVTIIEQHNSLAQEASGNPQGVLYSKLSANQTPLSRFIVQGYFYSLNRFNALNPTTGALWHPTGVVQLATSDKVFKRHQDLAQHFPEDLLRLCNKEELSQLAGMAIDHNGLYFPKAGWANPPGICKALANHPNISVVTNRTLDRIERTENGWLVSIHNTQSTPENHQNLTCKTVVIACATASSQLQQLSYIPLQSIRGQITQLQATEFSKALKTTVCGEGYTTPCSSIDGDKSRHGNSHTIGATFDFENNSNEVIEEEHKVNLAMQSQWFRSFYTALGEDKAQITGGRASFRCTTPDYLPAVGAVIDQESFIETFSMLRKNVKHRFTKAAAYQPGLYINAGHGSRGLITCPLSGELIAAMITGEALPVASDLIDSLNPTRFLVRALSRNLI